jgi:pimeloyl-ACP methyl ester carboxylesterase
VIAHDAEAQLARITAPILITFGRHDLVTSIRFADRLRGDIRGSELQIFEGARTRRYTRKSRSSTKRR